MCQKDSLSLVSVQRNLAKIKESVLKMKTTQSRIWEILGYHQTGKQIFPIKSKQTDSILVAKKNFGEFFLQQLVTKTLWDLFDHFWLLVGKLHFCYW